MSLFICNFLLTVFVGVFSEKRLVERNSLALLFENATADNPAKEVSLYINGVKDASLIVKWKFENGDIIAKWRMHTYIKIFMDGNRVIWIANMDQAYEGKYYIQSSYRREVELVVDAENIPSVTTRDNGIYHDTTLAAQNTKHDTEDTKGSNVSCPTSQKGLALCPLFVLLSIVFQNTVIFQMPGRIYAMIIFILVILGIVVIIAVAYKYRTYACRPCTTPNANGEQTMSLLENSEIWEQNFAHLTWEEIMELLNNEQKQGLHIYYGNLNRTQLWTNCFATLSWKDIKQLLSDDQNRGLQKYCNKLKTWEKLFSDDQQRLLGPYADLVNYSY